jgi:hypothetical protein
MTPDEAKALLKRLSYKSGWTFQMADSIYTGGWYLVIQMLVTERDGDKTIPVYGTFLVKNLTTLSKAGFLKATREHIHHMEKHEADEFIKVDGSRVFDPHSGHTVDWLDVPSESKAGSFSWSGMNWYTNPENYYKDAKLTNEYKPYDTAPKTKYKTPPPTQNYLNLMPKYNNWRVQL